MVWFFKPWLNPLAFLLAIFNQNLWMPLWKVSSHELAAANLWLLIFSSKFVWLHCRSLQSIHCCFWTSEKQLCRKESQPLLTYLYLVPYLFFSFSVNYWGTSRITETITLGAPTTVLLPWTAGITIFLQYYNTVFHPYLKLIWTVPILCYRVTRKLLGMQQANATGFSFLMEYIWIVLPCLLRSSTAKSLMER